MSVCTHGAFVLPVIKVDERVSSLFHGSKRKKGAAPPPFRTPRKGTSPLDPILPCFFKRIHERAHEPTIKEVYMRHIVLLITGFVLMFTATHGISYAAGLPLPYRIGGTITVSGVLLNQAAATGLVVTVKRADGSDYKDGNNNIAQDKDGLDSNNLYIVDIPIYDDTSQTSGAKTGDAATIHVSLRGGRYTVTEPAGGAITIEASGSTQIFNLQVTGGKRVRNDFDGDGKSDIIWRNAKTGDVVIWLMSGHSIGRGAYVVRGIPADWEVKAIDDFDGDGKADVLWQNVNNGDIYIWIMDSDKISGGGYPVHGVPGDWKFTATGDFDGDGKTDVLWQNTQTGDVALWLMDGARISSGHFVVKAMPAEWTLKAVADLNNDGKSDMLWQAANGDVYVWLMDGANISGGAYSARGIPSNWVVKTICNFDGDGKADVLWQNTQTGDVAIWLMDGATVLGGNYVARGIPGNWNILTTGDFDGDGKTDILWQDSSTGDIYIWLMDGLNITGGGFATRALPLDWWAE